MQEVAPAQLATIDIRPHRDRTSPDPVIMQKAREFESAFVTEMLKHSGLGEVRQSFNGGAGEAGFSGFLVQEYAEKISDTGRLGIAEQVYKALQARISK